MSQAASSFLSTVRAWLSGMVPSEPINRVRNVKAEGEDESGMARVVAGVTGRRPGRAVKRQGRRRSGLRAKRLDLASALGLIEGMAHAPDSLPTVVIGAGLSGLLLARALQARSTGVVVLEKSRGFGGRLATKRVGEVVFDQGAQFITVRDPVFAAEVEAWRRAGWVGEWGSGAHPRLIGRPAMTAVPKGLAVGLDIRREHQVTAVRRAEDGTWTLSLAAQPPLAAARVLLTCPVPQALALLDAGAVALPGAVRAALEQLTFHPCLALLAVLGGPSAVPGAGLALSDGPVRWLADNVKKGVAHGVPAAVTIHATPAFSVAHYAASEAEVAAQLL
ncbi:MAG: renalase, partial [Verrucomicrobiota bacterium]|nr:renalase [Verrucomicrobiota bacterium]